jgi:hypothetical protein
MITFTMTTITYYYYSSLYMYIRATNAITYYIQLDRTCSSMSMPILELLIRYHNVKEVTDCDSL